MRRILLYNCDSYTRSRIAEIKFARIIVTVAYAGEGHNNRRWGYIIICGYCRPSVAFLPVF
jgi:hypothetical protein